MYLPGRGPTGLQARVRNRSQLENQSHMVPKNGVSRWRRPNSDIYSQNYSVPEKLSWFIRQMSDGLIYSIQICEISHQTFGRSHRKCPMCPMIFMNTESYQFGLVYDMIYINFLAWRQRIISLVYFANNAIHPWPQVMQIFNWEMPPGFTPAICLHRNFVFISHLENRGDKAVDQNF